MHQQGDPDSGPGGKLASGARGSGRRGHDGIRGEVQAAGNDVLWPLAVPGVFWKRTLEAYAQPVDSPVRW